ncbi:MAG: FAD-dependent oxidoreductase [Chloroflexi bacterium]|nr:FAD-dependent oxidoreductase [Chloroflexota bacterium]MCI0866591.1 FAD-dependent oxidoreductase [Chloroflexota bacterium]
MANDYDVLIIGGGLAGMTAAMYAAQYGLRTGLIERMMGGAQIINIEKIENFPGFPQGVSGAELAPAVQEQAMNAGAEFIMAEVSGIARAGEHKTVASDAGEYRAKAVIVAAGSTLRKLGIPGEEELFGRGVSQCATCDGPLFMNEVVGVAGGGDSALDEALTLTDYAEKVMVFHRRDQLRAYKAIQDRVHNHRKIEMVWNTLVEEVLGEDTVSAVRVRNVVTNIENVVGLSGLFVFVGLEPNSSVVDGLVKVDNAGHIPVNISMQTEVAGLYAVGDIRQNSVSQLASAAGDGATAAISAFRYIRSKSW